MDIVLILLLILLNAFFAMAEIALVASRKGKLKHLALSGEKRAEIALRLAEKPSVFLSTVQIGITLVTILLGTIGDDSIVMNLSALLKPIPLIGLVHDQLAFTITIIVITYLSIVIGELVPKRVALSNPEKIASLAAPLMQRVSRIAAPIVRFLTISTESVFRLFGLKPGVESPVTEDEIRVLIREGTDMGIFNKTEKKLIERALMLDDLRVKMLMIPRHRISFFDLKRFVQNPRQFLANYPHSRIVFTEGGIDKVVGVVHLKDLLPYYLGEEKIDSEKIRNIMSRPLLVPENMRALKVLEMFRHSPVHIALVLDEFGSVQGLITLNDILEALVGEIKTQTPPDPLIVAREAGSLFVDGVVPIYDLKKRLRLEKLPKEDSTTFQTVGGFVISYLDRIPKTGDHFDWGGYRFEVVDMDDNRVDKVLIKKVVNNR